MKKALAVLLLAGPLIADPTTYVYTGNPFTSVDGLYTQLDSIDIAVTLDNPLPLNSAMQNYTADVLSWTFRDGVSIVSTPGYPGDTATFEFAVTNGVITNWDAGLGDMGFWNIIETTPAHDCTGQGGILSCIGASAFVATTPHGANFDDPGSWVDPEPALILGEIPPVPDAPEPGTAAMLAVAASLAGLGIFRSRV
jgi:hypothetical protein